MDDERVALGPHKAHTPATTLHDFYILAKRVRGSIGSTVLLSHPHMHVSCVLSMVSVVYLCRADVITTHSSQYVPTDIRVLCSQTRERTPCRPTGSPRTDTARVPSRTMTYLLVQAHGQPTRTVHTD